MLTKSETREIANKLGWEIKETEVAVKELLDVELPVESSRVSKVKIDCEEFLRVCVEAPNPEVRFIKIAEFLFKSLKGKLDEIICGLLVEPGPCFRAWAVFNASDIGETDVKISWDRYPGEFLATPYDKPPQDWYEGKKSFFKWAYYAGSAEEMLRQTKLDRKWLPMILNARIFYRDPRLNPLELCFEFLSTLVRTKSHNSEQLMFDVAPQIGFATFRVEAFRNLASDTSDFPFFSKRAKSLVAALNKSLRQTKITDIDGKYWLFYALSEILLKEERIKKQHKPNHTKVFRKVAQGLKKSGYKVSEGAVRREYYKKDKIVKQQNLTLESVIKMHHLYKAIEAYLKEAGKSN